MYAQLALSLIYGLGPGTGQTQSAETKAETVWWAPLKGSSVRLDNLVGVGSFIKQDHLDDPYYASTLTLTPSWSFTENLSLSAFFSLTYEWTALVTPCDDSTGPRPEGAPQKDCSDTNDPNRQRAALQDIELTLSHANLYTLGPVSFSAWGGFALPVSRASRHTGNVLTLTAGGSTNFEYNVFSANLGLGFRKFFPIKEAQVLSAEQAAEGDVPIGRCASFREAACVALSGFTSDWNLSVQSGLGVDIPWVDGLSFSVSFSYIYSRRHGRTRDSNSSPLVDADGNPVVSGTNADDSTVGSMEIAYSINDQFGLALGTYSWQPARTADGKKIRFPFYDTVSPANNYTTWYLSGSFSL